MNIHDYDQTIKINPILVLSIRLAVNMLLNKPNLDYRYQIKK